MRPDLQKRSIPVAIAAFLQRAFGREFGTYGDPQPGVAVEKRAKRYLLLLSTEERSLTFKIALENLRRECDLLMEEAALVPEGLELQRKVVELANRHEIADHLAREMLTEPPVAKLFNAILMQALKDGATAVQIDFNPDRDTFPVLLKTGGRWSEVMRIPGSLEEPLRGVIARVEGIGFAVVLPFLEGNSPLPQDLSLVWTSQQVLELGINP